MEPLSAISSARPDVYADVSTNTQNVIEAVQFLNTRKAAGPNNEIIVIQDPNKSGFVVQLVDSATRTVIRQISPASIFNLIQRYSR
jgi:hypothetical protein